MKIELVKVNFDDQHVFKYKSFEYCCEDLKDDDDIILTDENIVNLDYCYDSDYVIIPRLCGSHLHIWNEYGEEFEDVTNRAISFCPYCGEKIEIIVVDTVDMTEKYIEANKQRETLKTKRRKTDSKKEELKLSDEIRKLDDQINWFYKIGEWNGNEQTGL